MEYSEGHKRLEHAYNQQYKAEERKKFLKGIAKVGASLTLGFAALTGMNKLADAQKEGYTPESIYEGGKIEIVMSENLNVRETPIIIRGNSNEAPNTIEWSQIQQINGVDISGQKSFTIENPLLTEGENPSGEQAKAMWITVNATVKELLGEKKEKLYISFSPATHQYVKVVEEGNIANYYGTASEDTGKVTVTE